jgi:hypothetical protein
MAHSIDDLIHTRALIDGKWVLSRPCVGPFWYRLRDAIRVLLGKCDAVKFYKQ